MSVGPDTFPELFPIAGFKLGTACAGIKKPDHRDLVVMEIAAGSNVAAVFTQNAFCAAPVHVAKRHLAESAPRYFVVNTGNANAGTGEQGIADSKATCAELAEIMGVADSQVLPFSTGVIGEPLSMEKILAGLPKAAANLSESGWEDAGWGIMTTDTRPKGATRKLQLGGVEVHVSGISKGSGMINPNMATMLAYVATDAVVTPDLLQRTIQRAAIQSFNRITIDGDTSTNDACMLVATGQSGAEFVDSEDHPDYAALYDAIESVCVELAQAIVRDGEGATKFVTVQVEGGHDSQEAYQVAYAIAHSPLVKTALYASDANWGRILAAVGYAGLDQLDVNQVQIWLDDVCIVSNGGRAPGYEEAAGSKVMAQEEILIRVALNRGDATETLWTSDLSHDYVSINADYRT